MNRLKELRQKRKFTQSYLAEYLQIERSTYGKYETNKSDPPTDTWVKLANLYGVSIDYLIGETESEIRKAENIVNEHDTLRNEALDLYDNLPESVKEQALNFLRFLASGSAPAESK